MNARDRAEVVYGYIDALASDNSTLQGISGVVGMGLNLLVDVATLSARNRRKYH